MLALAMLTQSGKPCAHRRANVGMNDREEVMAGSKTRDLWVGKAGKVVKGGDRRLNDNVTLVRAAKPKRDLPASKVVKAGGKRLNDNVTLVRAAKPKGDLPASKVVKAGGRKLCNDNITLIRMAKPKKDLSASKDVKAGKKAAR